MTAETTFNDEVAAAVAWLRARGVRGLKADSRCLRPGDAFVAWPGAATDARRYVRAALQAGAPAALVEAEGLSNWLGTHPQWAFDVATGQDSQAPVRAVFGLRQVAGALASAFWDHPSRVLDVVAITGTNGKTSTAWWTAQWLQAAGRAAGLIGTLGVGQPGAALQPTGLTTPDPVTLQRALRRFADEGVRAVALEASSIGIAEGRLDGAVVHTAVFTNLTQDHLDYHGSMANYWAAKRRLFDWPGLRVAVVCVDDPHGQELARELAARRGGPDLWTYATGAGTAARLRLQQCIGLDEGVRFTVAEGTQQATFTPPVVGDYNVANLLAVLAVLRSQGLPWSVIEAASAGLTPVPGRMQPAWSAADGSDAGLPLVLVDYAHTPDAVTQALRALRPLAQRRGGRLWCVLGCGGDRDPSKRPWMAALAERYADGVVLTSDNPRSEDPLHILSQMQQGLRDAAAAHVEPDRAAAIDWAVRHAAAADVVLLAGKGHEDYQEVAGVRLPFSDLAEARAALQRRREGQR